MNGSVYYLQSCGVFYIMHAHSAISANSATSINVDGAAAELASDHSAMATSLLSAEHQLVAVL